MMIGGEPVGNYIWNSIIDSGSSTIYDFIIEIQDNTTLIKTSHCPSNYQSNNNSRNSTVDSSNFSSYNLSKNGSASGNSAVFDGQNSSVGTRNSSVNSSKNNANYNPVDI